MTVSRGSHPNGSANHGRPFHKTIPSELWSCQPFARREDALFRTLVNPYGKGHYGKLGSIMCAEVTSVFFSHLSVGRDLAASNLKFGNTSGY